MVGGGRAVRRGLAEVVLGALACAVLLQVARHVLAREPRRNGPHVLKDFGGHRLVSAQRLHSVHKAFVQLLSPLHLASAQGNCQTTLTTPVYLTSVVIRYAVNAMPPVISQGFGWCQENACLSFGHSI